MKSGISALLLFITFCSYCQVLTVQEISRNSGDYVFPLIQSSQRPAIAKKVNSIIQQDLGSASNNEPFADLENEDTYSFDRGAANERLLCLIVTGSHTGAGYHVTRHVYNFDSRTGELIDLDKLFGADGQSKLRKVLCKYWKDAVKANQNTEPKEEYQACMNDAKTRTEIDVARMLIQEKSIQFWGGQCLDGSQYEYDQTTGPYELSVGQLLPMLTPYGYSLFIEKKSAAPFETLLRGTIDGKYPIRLTLLPGSSGTVNGTIAYDKVGQPINLKGTQEGQNFVIHELDDAGNPLSDIKITWTGSQLTGTFINYKSKKQMTFAASPVAK
ncbi:MAG TPA: hypothetical protein VG737_02110 [Cyclobacteriaceae bacterium]|nr:hypothetical protein [Cyclobacteriaceae bacterium]